MKTLMLQVEDEIMDTYQSFSPENKRLFGIEIDLLVREVDRCSRSARAKKIIDELKNEPYSKDMNPDILLELLRCDE